MQEIWLLRWLSRAVAPGQNSLLTSVQLYYIVMETLPLLQIAKIQPKKTFFDANSPAARFCLAHHAAQNENFLAQ
ncbi:hypothetical protein [Herpetosiphon giganteus]|uniref:hypothetical protein n=1 Tax=Herpetosiphon giganteus TaxID=2029754 RepID=UPI0019595AA6|nr:hypothetical protein [Herpetosiphon giganteus]MBM7842369.1 hypothetical protein [Herpetosiphon giganteus]